MSQEQVEVVRQLYEALNAGNPEAVADLAHPDVEWIPDTRVGEEPLRGRKNVIRFFADMASTFDEMRAEPERFWDKEDKVLVFVRVTGRGHASGAEFDIKIGHLWTVHDGLVVRGEGYGDRATKPSKPPGCRSRPGFVSRM
jgi:uncharacterized protein